MFFAFYYPFIMTTQAKHFTQHLPNLAENFGVNRLGYKNCQTAAFAASIHFEMGLFSKKDDYNRVFSRNERVVAAYDLPGVPERTGGKVKMVNGFEWQRYWVFFDNGVQLGSLDGSALLRPHHWERWRGEREEVMAEMKSRMEAVVAEQEALLELAENPESAAPAAELPASADLPESEDAASDASAGPAAGVAAGPAAGVAAGPAAGVAAGPAAGSGSAAGSAAGTVSAAGSAEASAGESAPSGEAAALLAKLPDHLVERSRLARTRLGG